MLEGFKIRVFGLRSVGGALKRSLRASELGFWGFHGLLEGVLNRSLGALE